MISRALFDKEDTYSLRGLCMLAIIAHHLYHRTTHFYGVDYPIPFNFILQDAGYLSTAVFFLISGYGLTLSLWKKKTHWQDAIRRISKLYLPFLFFWIVSTVLLTLDGGNPFPGALLGLVTFDLPIMGGGEWFIISILALYILLIIISRFVDSPYKAAIIMIALVSVYVIVQLTVLKLPPLWYNSIMAFPLGVLCAARQEKVQRYNTKRISWIMLLFFVISYLLSHYSGSSYSVLLGSSFVPIFQIIAALSFSCFTLRLVSIVNIRCDLLKYIGTWSFSVFLAHQILVIYANKCSNLFVYVFAVIAGTFVLTWVYSIIHIIVFNKKLKTANT